MPEYHWQCLKLIELNQAAAQYTPTNLRTICPALILAAKRNERVMGRTIILVVSINTKNGLSHSGAPSGRKWAFDALVFFENLDRIIDSQSGRPNLRVKIKCLDKLNVQGINPIKLIEIIITNRGVTSDLIPFKLNINVRESWVKIKEKSGDKSAILRDDLVQNIDCIRIIANIFVYRNSVVDGTVELNENGSKDEKISNIILKYFA